MELEIKNVSQVLNNGTQTLDKVSLRIQKGVFGLVGPNVSGKSTLVDILASLVMPTSGQITLRGELLEKSGKKVGYLPQKIDFYSRISILDFLDNIAIMKGIQSKKVREDSISFLTFNLGLDKMAYIGECLTSEKKMLGIAQAFLGSPDLVVLDNPFEGLDSKQCDLVYRLINEYKTSSIIFLTTDGIEHINNVCDNFAIIKKGKIVFEGKVREALGEIQGNIYEAFLEKTGGIEEEFLRRGFHVISKRKEMGIDAFRIYSERSLPQFISAKAEFKDLYNRYLSPGPSMYF